MGNRGSIHIFAILMLVLSVLELRLLVPYFHEDYQKLSDWWSGSSYKSTFGLTPSYSKPLDHSAVVAQLRSAVADLKDGAGTLSSKLPQTPDLSSMNSEQLSKRLAELEQRIAQLKDRINIQKSLAITTHPRRNSYSLRSPRRNYYRGRVPGRYV